MRDRPARDDAYCTAIEQIKQILAKYRPDVPNLRGNAVLSPRILMLLIERSEGEIPPEIFERLRPLAEAVRDSAEVGIAELVGSDVPADVKSDVETKARSAYEAIGDLHADVMKCP